MLRKHLNLQHKFTYIVNIHMGGNHCVSKCNTFQCTSPIHNYYLPSMTKA